MPIIAITDKNQLSMNLSVAWNVTPILVKDGKTIEDTIQKGIAELEKTSMLEKGNKIVLAGGIKKCTRSSRKQSYWWSCKSIILINNNKNIFVKLNL